MCVFVECSDLAAPHGLYTEASKLAKESEKHTCKAVLSKLLYEYKDCPGRKSKPAGEC